MGIYDREYYRRDGPSILGALGGRGQACKWLIVANVVAFVIQLLTGSVAPEVKGAFSDLFILNVGEVLHGEVWRLLSYAFLHAGLMHIAFNMLFLWWFGSDVEDIYGTREFLVMYLLAAVLGGVAFTAAAEMHAGGQYCLGASGAVTAVLVLCAFHFPHRVILLFFILPVPIWLFVIFEVAQDLFGFLGGGNKVTAYSVHLAGAAFAFLYYQGQWRLTNFWPSFRSWGRRRTRPRLRVYHEEESGTPVSVTAPADPNVDEHLEAKVDAVLEKVARFGQSSLTESEKQLLFRASEVYKRRRQ